MTQLESVVRKIFSSGDYYLEVLRSFPEDTLFEPSNKSGEKFSICTMLFEQGLILKNVAPIWINGSFKGTRVSFLYREDLNYPTYSINTNFQNILS